MSSRPNIPIDPFNSKGQVVSISIGSTQIVIDRFIAEGGFARVYAGRRLSDNFPVAIKRIICPQDSSSYKSTMKEVELMKRLKHKNIVEYIDSHVSNAGGGNIEILIAMEYCQGGQLVDLMNRRLHNRFQESEVLQIFEEICEAIAYLHYSQPPIIHRDIKVENVLLSGRSFKLCDFGSCSTTIIAPGTALKAHEISYLEEEIDKETTIQYRAPEMCDLYRRRGLNEKTDIWALGVLLYKLCYFVTPFETDGKLAILNNKYQIPEYPGYSQPLKELIRKMLADNPAARPNIFLVLESVCKMMGIKCPIENIYPEQQMPIETPVQHSVLHTVQQTQQPIQNVQVSPPSNQRRGRVGKATASAKPINDLFNTISSEAPSTISAPIVSIVDTSVAVNAFANTGNDDPFANLGNNDATVTGEDASWAFETTESFPEPSAPMKLIDEPSQIPQKPKEEAHVEEPIISSSTISQIADLDFNAPPPLPPKQIMSPIPKINVVLMPKPTPMTTPLQLKPLPNFPIQSAPITPYKSNFSGPSTPKSQTSSTTASPGGWSSAIANPNAAAQRNRGVSQPAIGDPFSTLVSMARPTTGKK